MWEKFAEACRKHPAAVMVAGCLLYPIVVMVLYIIARLLEVPNGCV